MTLRYPPERLWRAYRHCWWVVARSCDIGQPRAATLLDQPLVVFRDAGGTARVLDRRCVHRGADLAAGAVGANGLVCPYHGWAFDGGSGQCRHIPSLAPGGAIPSNARVRSYPVMERYEHVWTCLETPLVDVPQPPEIADLTLEWLPAAPIPARCGYMAAVENFLDMSHFAYVHGGSMGAVSAQIPPLEIQRDGARVATAFRYPQVAGAEFSGIGDAWMHYHAYAPGYAGILYDYDRQGRRYLVDFPSPVSAGSCIVYWAVAVDKDFRGGSVADILKLETGVFDEDTPILDGLMPPEVSLNEERGRASCPADAFTLSYRRAAMGTIDHILGQIDAQPGADQ